LSGIGVLKAQSTQRSDQVVYVDPAGKDRRGYANWALADAGNATPQINSNPKSTDAIRNGLMTNLQSGSFHLLPNPA
jgi:hypothetical protein